LQLKENSGGIRSWKFLIGEYVTVLTDTRLRWPKEEAGASVVVCNTGFEDILVFDGRGGLDKRFFLCNYKSKMIKLIIGIIIVPLVCDRYKIRGL
jgi:hypothetical protein